MPKHHPESQKVGIQLAKIPFTGPSLDALSVSFSGCRDTLWKAFKPAGGWRKSIPRPRGMPCKYADGLYDAAGDQVGVIGYDEPTPGFTHVRVTGPAAQDLQSAMRRLHAGRYRVTRMDVAYDYAEAGSWDQIYAVVQSTRAAFRSLSGEVRGDLAQPEKGLSVYLGSRSSTATVCCYMRGRHPDYKVLANPHLVRVEFRLEPKGKEAQYRFAACDFGDALGITRWVRFFATELLGAAPQPIPGRPKSKPTNDERVLYYLASTYYKRLARAAIDSGGWNRLGKELRRLYDESLRHKSA